MDDEFGDASFLDDFDVDAAVASQSQPLEASHQVTPTSDATAPSIFFADSNKRSKTSTAGVTPTNASDEKTLETALHKFFGFEGFRSGQLPVLQALLQNQDVAVFWATGNGKSMCYQLPALVTGRISIVISPLISLMQDQVRKLNHSIASVVGLPKIATYLGSAQRDPNEEARALRGEYLFVYVTPEKLLSSNFLNSLARLSHKIGLVAFDEAHCVSQWGHDFRPEYRQAGLGLRKQLPHIPIVALTATAVPSIQKDIMDTLQLNDPLIEQQSLDRPNLQITCKVKSSSEPARCAMEELIRRFVQEDKSSRNLSKSTIVYAPTRASVEELASILQQRLATTFPGQHLARAYHAGMDTVTRQEIHEDFLTGQLPIVVATTAFGMGIDKPDIRRVVHYGPPKNVEEYYQQMGRAGRDGKPSQCWMYYSHSDFDKYLTDFYIGKLEGKARENAIASTNALKKYALDSQTCRRKSLLEFFQETPPFGERCGTCDTCLVQKKYANDGYRNFAGVARYIMGGIQILKDQGMTILLKVLNGATVEHWRYNDHQVNDKKLDQKRKTALPNMKVTNDLIKDFLSELVRLDYVRSSIKKYKKDGFINSVTVYSLSSKGNKSLFSKDPIMLPVPHIIREKEELAAKKRQELQEKLSKKGMQVSNDELQDLDGPAFRAYSTWFHSLERKEASGQDTAVYDELLQLIEGWRSKTAIQQRMAPAAVMPEHLVFSVAYMTSSLLPGCQVEIPALVAVGVRSSTVQELADVLNDWVKRNKHQGAASSPSEQPLVPPAGLVKMPKWKYAVFKVIKKTGEPSWMPSYVRFVKDKETTQEIAMTKRDRPIQAATVVSHLQDAMQLGYPMDLQRLVPNSNAPTKEQWDRLEESIASRGMDVLGDPETSGVNAGKFYLKDCLRGIMGDEFIDKDFKERTPEESAEYNVWMNELKWYICLKRVGFVPSFGSASSDGVQLAPDASKYTVPTTKDEEKLMAKNSGTKKWIIPSKSS